MLVTRNILYCYALMEYLLYTDFTITAYYFLSQMSTGSLRADYIINMAKYLLIVLLFIFSAIVSYFLVLMIMQSNEYKNCRDPAWIACRVAAIILGIVYFGIGLKASFELKKLRNNSAIILEKQGEQDLW